MTHNSTTIDVPPEMLGDWQEICDILADILKLPAALIMRRIESDIEVFVSSRSEGNPYRPGERERLEESGLYCETVMRKRETLLVPDALADPRWKNNPDVRLNMISYLGVPILLPDGKAFGTLCVLDRKSNEHSEAIQKLMEKFRRIVESQLNILFVNRILEDRNRGLVDHLEQLQSLRGVITICSGCKSIRNKRGDWLPIERYLIRHPRADFSHGICPDCVETMYPEFHRKKYGTK